MPQIADITVKKADGTTNVTLKALVPSSGDKTPAVWRNNADSTVPSNRTEYRVVAGSNANRTARRVEISGSAPYVDAATGKVTDRVNFEMKFYVGQGIPETVVNDKVSEITNFAASELIKSAIVSGFAPT